VREGESEGVGKQRDNGMQEKRDRGIEGN